MKFLWAMVISLALHALLAAGLALYFAYAPEPEALAMLDLSSVELSFAETADESAAVVPLPPAPPLEEQLPETRPPEPRVPEFEMPPPDLAAEPDFPKPEEKIEPMRELDLPKEKPVEEKSVEKAEEKSVPVPPVPAVAPRQAKIDAPPRPKRTIRPEYPKSARQRGEQGDVNLEITVGADGRVSGARIVASSGFADLDAAALKAVREAKFVPAKSGGKSVASAARITLQFKLK